MEHMGLEVWELLRAPVFSVKLEAGLLAENKDGERVLQVFREIRRYETLDLKQAIRACWHLPPLSRPFTILLS